MAAADTGAQDEQPYTIDRFGRRKPLEAPGKDGPISLPAGVPDESWNQAQLEAYADTNAIDFGSAKNKPDRVRVINEHLAARGPALPPQ